MVVVRLLMPWQEIAFARGLHFYAWKRQAVAYLAKTFYG
jgi:hypothetical protein